MIEPQLIGESGCCGVQSRMKAKQPIEIGPFFMNMIKLQLTFFLISYLGKGKGLHKMI